MRTPDSNVHCLGDGTTVRTRPLRPSDRAKLLRAFEHFSADSRYRRFFSPTPRLSGAMLDRLLDVDGHDRVAIGAELLRYGWFAGPGLGVARFTRLPDARHKAEMAISIVDEMQGCGLGTLLVHELSRVARAHGVHRFTAWVQPDNEPMKALVAKIDPLAHSHVEDGLLVFDFAVPGALGVRARPLRRPVPSSLGSLVDWCGDGLRQLLPA
jgi:RimJ/RimL family protein N-acetyltransferase